MRTRPESWRALYRGHPGGLAGAGTTLSALHRGALVVEQVDQRQVCGREAPGPLHAEALSPAGWSRNRHDEGLWGTLLGAKVLQTWNVLGHFASVTSVRWLDLH